LANVDFVAADVFHHLADLAAKGETYDVIVLDPPKFARDRKSVPDAIRGYRRLHQLALQLLAPDGILVSCCCSGLVSAADLDEVIAQCAVKAKRDLQLLERRGPSPDHPVAISCPESGYLKCVVLRAG
jgi:23S rRNA (cytosine1962-C5)-methyltransferase